MGLRRATEQEDAGESRNTSLPPPFLGEAACRNGEPASPGLDKLPVTGASVGLRGVSLATTEVGGGGTSSAPGPLTRCAVAHRGLRSASRLPGSRGLPTVLP